MDIEYEEIKKIEFANKIPSEKLKAIFVVGQTGSGKTTLIKSLLQDVMPQEYVIIDNDRWRPFAPKYKEIVMSKGTDEVKDITEYIKKWRSRIFDECIEKHYSIIYHTSMTNVKEIISQVYMLQKDKYDVSLVVVACNELESKLSNCGRYIYSVLRQGIW